MKVPRKIPCQTQSAAGTSDSSLDSLDFWNQPFAADLEAIDLGNWIESGAVTTSPPISSPSNTEHPAPLRRPSLHQTGGSGQDTVVRTNPRATEDAVGISICGTNTHYYSACIAPLRSVISPLSGAQSATIPFAGPTRRTRAAEESHRTSHKRNRVGRAPPADSTKRTTCTLLKNCRFRDNELLDDQRIRKTLDVAAVLLTHDLTSIWGCYLRLAVK